VRKALLAFLTWILSHVANVCHAIRYCVYTRLKILLQDDLIPHSSLLVLFATSAQTHIFPEIRIDAIHFLDLFLEHIPDAVVEGWSDRHGSHGNRVLEGYLGILNTGMKFGGSENECTVSRKNDMFFLLT
jgi:pre-rRNA-processing protein IPI1